MSQTDSNTMWLLIGVLFGHILTVALVMAYVKIGEARDRGALR